MAETPTTDGTTGRFDVRVTADTHFGWIRTRLSLERTMMSWLRTGVALIGFGFAIVQYLNHLAQFPGAQPAYLPGAPQYLGLSLIFCGILSLVVAILQYRFTLRYLWSGSYSAIAGVKEEGMQTPILAVAALLTFIGLFAFFAVLLRLA